MRRFIKYFYISFFISLLFLASCTNSDTDNIVPGAGSVDFTSYVAVGNSLTAGYADGALYFSGQQYGWTNILAQQMKSVGMKEEFKIPYMPTENGVGSSEGAQGTPVLRTKLILGHSTDCLGNSTLAPVPAEPNASQALLYFELITSVAARGPYNNLGIPGITVTDLFDPNLAKTNPFFGRIAYHSTDTLETYAAKVSPTFFSLWIGNNDVLGYASSGGTGREITPMDGAVGTGFKASMEAEVKYLTSLTGEGVIADIPDITSIPYFNTIPYNAIILSEQSQVDQLNAAYAQYNNTMEALGLSYRISFKTGANPMVIADPDMSLPDSLSSMKIRQIKSDELVILEIPLDSLKCAGWGTQKPIANQYILTEKEIQNVQIATSEYNTLIQSLAQQYDLAFVDFYAIMKNIQQDGVTVDGIHFTTGFITGNLFSLDGVHLTKQGNALIANYFIDAINKKYGSKIPKVTVSDYPSITIPE